MYCRAIKSGFAPAGRDTSELTALWSERPASKSGMALLTWKLTRRQGCSVLADAEKRLDFCQRQKTFLFDKLSRPAGLAFTQPPNAWVSGALWRWERCWSVKLTAHFRVEVQNDGRCTSSPPYALMNYVNALDNARKIALAYFCLSRGGILHAHQQLRSNAFEHKLLNKTIGSIITITS